MINQDAAKHPGEIIKSILLQDTKISQDSLATALGVSRRSVNELVTGRRSISAEMSCRLERVSGVSAITWLSLQAEYDISQAKRKLSKEIRFNTIRKLSLTINEWHFVPGDQAAAEKQVARGREWEKLQSKKIKPAEIQHTNRFIKPEKRRVTFVDYDECELY